MTTKTITVGIEDAQVGDAFAATFKHGDGTGATSVITGKLYRAYSDVHGLYVTSNLPSLFIATLGKDFGWQSISLTREVPVRTRIGWLKDLPVGTWFKTPNGGAHFVKISDDRIDRLDSGHIMSYPITTHYFGNAEFRDGDYKILEPEVKS